MYERRFRANFRFVFTVSIIVLFLGAFSIITINRSLKQHALNEAQEKAMMLLDRNLATHTYFSHQLKPVVFEKLNDVDDRSYFEPKWMSSTYAVREIDKYYHSLSKEDYYYKEAAINARSPENEADDFEKKFLQKLNESGKVDELSKVRFIDGKPYFTVLRRGETMERNCLRCHSTPEAAPKDLVAYYGPNRSFGRFEGEVVSAVSIRIPLASAYANIQKIIVSLAIVSVITLLVLSGLAIYLGKRWIYGPIAYIGSKAKDISENPKQVGVQIDLPESMELAELAKSFNSMSLQLREERDQLEKKISERTRELKEANYSLEQEVMLKEKTIAELKEAMSEIKTLSGLLPICMHCKKIRDDKGYWNQIETYVAKHTDTKFSHSICQECAKTYYPDVDIYSE